MDKTTTIHLVGIKHDDLDYVVRETIEGNPRQVSIYLDNFRKKHPEADDVVASASGVGIIKSQKGVNWCQRWIENEVNRAMSYRKRGISFIDKIYYNKSASKEWGDRNQHLSYYDFWLYEKNNTNDSDKQWYAGLINNMRYN